MVPPLDDSDLPTTQPNAKEMSVAATQLLLWADEPMPGAAAAAVADSTAETALGVCHETAGFASACAAARPARQPRQPRPDLQLVHHASNAYDTADGLDTTGQRGS